MLLIKSIDLHGNRLEEANKIIEQFINESYLENLKFNNCSGKGLHSQNAKNPYLSKDLKF